MDSLRFYYVASRAPPMLLEGSLARFPSHQTPVIAVPGNRLSRRARCVMSGRCSALAAGWFRNGRGRPATPPVSPCTPFFGGPIHSHSRTLFVRLSLSKWNDIVPFQSCPRRLSDAPK